MEQFIKYVGLDVHGKTIAVAVADSRSNEVRFIGQIANTPAAMVKLVNQLQSKGAMLSFCYEAGPCGYGTSVQKSPSAAWLASGWIRHCHCHRHFHPAARRLSRSYFHPPRF